MTSEVVVQRVHKGEQQYRFQCSRCGTAYWLPRDWLANPHCLGGVLLFTPKPKPKPRRRSK